jgi:hypothetical protein
MTSKERIRAAIEHRQPDCLPIDFGASFITGIHCSAGKVHALGRMGAQQIKTVLLSPRKPGR